MSDDGTTIQKIAHEFSLLVEPIGEVVDALEAGDTEPLENLVAEIGLTRELLGEDLEIIKSEIETLAQHWSVIQTEVIEAQGFPPVEKLDDIIEAVKGIVKGIKQLDDLQFKGENIDNVGDNLLDYLILQYLMTHHRKIYSTLQLTGVAVENPFQGPDDLKLDKLGKSIQNPQEAPKELVGWGTEDPTFELLWTFLRDFAVSNNIPAHVEPAETEDATEFSPCSKSQLDDYDQQKLVVPIIKWESGVAGLEFVPVPACQGQYPGVSMILFGAVAASIEEDISDEVTFSFDLEAQTDAFGLYLDPEDPPSLEAPNDPGEAHATGELTYNPSGDASYSTLLGDPEGTRVAFGSVSAKASFDYADEEVEVRVALPVDGRLDVNPQGGFLEKVVPPEGIGYAFTASVGWSNVDGVFFHQGGKLEAALPTKIDMGPLTLMETFVAVIPDAEDADFRLEAAASANVKLGPIAGSVKRMGISADVTFPKNRKGNTGPLDIDVGFRPPDGLGLSIDAAAVKGGGYLEFEPEKHRYSGVFQATIGPVNVKIMGLLKTRLPDGSKGFSLLLSISAEFGPIQLSFGFTLNGLGGVLGINRSIKTDPLGKAVKTGNLDSVLFPDDPVANAQQIISDLRAIYPPTKQEHVFGPMARFGWGTPALIYIDMGIILQFPSFKIVLVGNIQMAMPTLEAPEEAQIIRLNLAVMGSLEPEKKLLKIRASLYDSRVLTWTVKGGMAMRLRWGDKPEFVLSVGGFNPRFEPPEDFPEVERVTVSLDIPGGTPTVKWTGYFAVTSNTVQVGASFDAKFEAGPVSAHGYWSLDALFQFDPFKFVVDFAAGISVSAFGFTLSIELNGSIKGPSPVHITGKISFSLPGPIPDPSPKVDITLGEEKEQGELSPADVLGELGKAVMKPKNWSAELPEQDAGLASLREIETGDDEVVAHPRGRINVRQTVVPLAETVEKFGNAAPNHEEFDLEIASATGTELPEMDGTLSESFAPAQYEEMSDSEKLNSPSFEKMNAGREVSADLFHWGCVVIESGSEVKKPENAAAAELEYEHPQYDSEVEDMLAEARTDGGDPRDVTPEDPTGGYPVEIARSLADDGAVANADSRWKGADKFVPKGPGSGEVEIESSAGAIDPVTVTESGVSTDQVLDDAVFGGGSE